MCAIDIIVVTIFILLALLNVVTAAAFMVLTYLVDKKIEHIEKIKSALESLNNK